MHSIDSTQNKKPTEIEDKNQKNLEYQKQYRATHKTQKQEYMKNNKEKLAEFQRKYDRERRANKDDKYITALKERQKKYREKKKMEKKANDLQQNMQSLELMIPII
jgi:hypothetical protein